MKNTFTKCKKWIKDNRKVIFIGTGIAVVGGSIIGLIKNIANTETNVESLLSDETIDYGRECIMRFIVEDTQEVLGEAKCTEYYAKQMMDICVDNNLYANAIKKL